MQRERYRYDQWPEGGIHGVTADDAVEFAARGTLAAYVFLDGVAQLKRIHRHEKPIREDNTCGYAHAPAIVRLFAWDVLHLEQKGERLIHSFEYYRDELGEKGDVADWFYSIEDAKHIPPISREQLIFYTRELQELAAPTQGADAAKNTLQSIVESFATRYFEEYLQPAGISEVWSELERLSELDDSFVIVDIRRDRVWYQARNGKEKQAARKTVQNYLSAVNTSHTS